MDFRFIIIDKIIDKLDHPLVIDLLPKTVKMKLDCFHLKFDSGYLPVDTNDWIGTHLIVCRETQNGLEPVLTTKFISKKVMEFFHKEFVGKTCTDSAHLPTHKKIIEEWLKNKEDVAYISSFAVSDGVGMKEKYELIKSSFSVMCDYLVKNDIPQCLTLGAVKTKANSIFKKLGFEPVLVDGKVLDYVPLKEYGNEMYELLFLEKEKQKENIKSIAYLSL